MELSATLLLSGYALLLLLAGAGAFLGYRRFPRLVRDSSFADRASTVSVIIAAKEEADTLRGCLASLMKLERPPKEVIVVCGPSRDGTESVAREFNNVHVLGEPERPPDWVGKSWALHEGYLRSSGDILLFTDGDVIHSPDSLDVIVSRLETSRADLLSLWPQIVTRVPSERTILPTSIFFLCAGIAAAATKRTPRGMRIYGANGQYIMIRRSAYESIGGHVAIKNDIMEDGAMGRRALNQGLEVINANGQGFLKVEPYVNFEEIWEAHERFGAGLIPSVSHLIGACILTLAFFLLPFLLLASAVVTANRDLAAASGLICTIVYGTQVFFASKASKIQYFLLAPLSGLLVTAAFLSGFLRFRRDGITWKHVKYASDRFKHL